MTGSGVIVFAAMRNAACAGALVFMLALSGLGRTAETATDPKHSEPKSTAPTPSPAKLDKAPGALRRDKAGVKGISPFWEDLNRGDAAFIARDLAGAIAAYRAAITEQPQNALGHYRIAEAHIAALEHKQADEAIASGLRFATNDPVLKAKLMFLLADVRERQKSYDDASERWSEYEKWAVEQKSAKGYEASATERKKAILTWKQVSEDSLAVKARIDKRLKEAEAAMRKSSK